MGAEGEGTVARTYNKWAILFTVIAMTFMVCLDTSIVNVALPVMAAELGVKMADIEWVATAYMLVSCAGMLVCGRLGDIYGKVRVFQVGVVLFTLGSALCGFAPNLPVLIASRALQGLGGAAAFSCNQGIITETFPASERGHALGWLATVAAVGSMVGPAIGGLLLSTTGWSSIFLVNVPVGIISFVIGLRTLPNRSPEHPGTLDVPGSALLFSSLLLVVGSVTLMQQQMGIPEIAALVVGLVLLGVFVHVERRCGDPVFPLRVLKNRILILNMVTLFAMFFIIGGQNLLLPFYFQDARGMTALQAALLLTVIPIVTSVVGPIAGAVSDRIGCYWPTSVGLGVVAVAELMLASMGLGTTILFMVVALVAYGLGDAMFMAPNNSLIMGSAPSDELGLIGGLAAFSRLFGQVVGLTFCTSTLYARMSTEAGYAVADFIDGRADIFIDSMSLVFVLMALVIGVGFVATVMRFVAFRRDVRAAS